MTLPIDLVLVRHGQSEGNLAKRLSEEGDNSAHARVYEGRHTQALRLTDRGRNQAKRAGIWIRENFGKFDRHYVSGYARALETAGLLELNDARWYQNPYLTERDWGHMDGLTEEERAGQYARALAMRDVEPYYWAPPNGESFNALCLRQERVLDTLHREQSDKSDIVVCHGEVMWAYRAIIERMAAHEFKQLHLSDNSFDRIHNCEIIHYTRRLPRTRELAPYLGWFRMIRPTETPVWVSGWCEIKRRTYSSDDLLALIEEHYPRRVS